MSKLNIRCFISHPCFVLHGTYCSIHCPTMCNYYCKESTDAHKIYGACTGNQLPVFTVKSTGSFYSVHVHVYKVRKMLEHVDRPFAYLLICVPIEDTNQPVHPHSLIRVFTVRMKKRCILGCPKCFQCIYNKAANKLRFGSRRFTPS